MMTTMMSPIEISFALSPFPSYLPQYVSMMRQLSSTGDDRDDRWDEVEASPNGASPTEWADRANGEMRKRHSEIAPASSAELVGTPSKRRFSAVERETKKQYDTGMSRVTVLLLLAAHEVRLLYFHGVLLGERTQQQTETEAGSESALKYDLLGQSIAMIIVQLMLLHGMILLRRKQHGGRTKRRSSSFIRRVGSMGQISPTNSANNSSPNDSRGSTERRSTETIQNLSRSTLIHFTQLFSPSRILKQHTFMDFVELLIVSSMIVKVAFDYHWYPIYGDYVVESLKNVSVILESCLALPQGIRNYRNKSTDGLSVFMVVGWVGGDAFKLMYFIYNMFILSGEGRKDDGATFIAGCLVAILFDLLVVFQLTVWYPNPEVLGLRSRIEMAWRHWKTNKDDRDDLLGGRNATESQDGFALRAFKRVTSCWTRGKSRATQPS